MSDGLAEVAEGDVASVIVPELTKKSRQDITPYIKGLLSGTLDVKSKIIAMIASNNISYP